MPSISEPERKFMDLVNAVRKGAPAPSPEIEKIVNQYDIKTDKDIETMQEEEDLLFGASAEELEELREYIRSMVREITGTGNVAGYLTPNAFGKPGDEEKNAERAADLTGYSVVPESLNENRWLKLKKENTPPHAKIGKGISEINKQLSEMERFLNWYGRIKNENGVSNSAYWSRTNKTLFRIKERLIKIESSIRKIAG